MNVESEHWSLDDFGIYGYLLEIPALVIIVPLTKALKDRLIASVDP
jgi:hypothetical protein